MPYKQWRHNKTKQKHADTLINMGEKFYYAAFMIPIAIFLKYGIFDGFIATCLSFTVFGISGILLQKEGLKIYDSLQNT